MVDGCPPRVEIDVAEIQADLDRRRPGASSLTTPRKEADQVRILSGLFEGETLGTPILLMVDNQDARSKDYEKLRQLYRPSHADFTYDARYGIRNWKGGGRASARETVGRVAAGAIARKIARQHSGIEIIAYVRSLHELVADIDRSAVTAADVERSEVRCPDSKMSRSMATCIQEVQKAGDSVGGVIECVVRNVPPGLGCPVFDKLEADLASGMMSIPASKGFEIGSGFSGTTMRGSEHNDPFVLREGKIGTGSNRSGGIQGGISNGEEIYFRVAFKPTATIAMEQKTVTVDKKEAKIIAGGRHDPCVLPRAVPIVEAMTALVLVDHLLRYAALGTGSE